MEMASTPLIRNVALLGHSGSGKTTLAEALLNQAGAIPRVGRVEDGTTTCDTEPEEVKRSMSLSLAVAPFQWKASDGETYKVNLIDTPGYADFASQVDAGLSVADLAVIVVSAVDGVEVGTEAAWQLCEQAGIPRLLFVNKEDRPRADFHAVLDRLKESFGDNLVPLELPLGEEEDLHGVADVLSDQGLEYDADGHHRTEAIPEDLLEEERALHEEVAEEIVAGDDEQLERYLSGEVPSAEDLERTLRAEVLERSEFPVLLGSAATGVGIDRLADFVCELGPSPADRPSRAVMAGEPTEVPADAAGKPLVHVFRTAVDQFVGQLSFFKVLSGTIKADDHLTNTTTGTDERLHGMFFLQGREHVPAAEVVAGDIAAVPKLSASPTGSTLAPKGVAIAAVAATTQPPAYALALQPVTQADDDKLLGSLQRVCAEDPSLVVERNEETGQTVLRGAGDTHLAVALERMERKFGVSVTTEDVLIPYRETIGGTAEAEGKVKKQSGGHGQFAVVQLRVSPLGRGEGTEFVDSIVGGAIPRNYIPAVERGVNEAMEAGGVNGFPVVDVKVECYDGKYHSVDSSDMAFRTASAVGLREALQRAQPLVLEPVSEIVVTVPDGSQGDVMGDLTSRRGRISGSNTLADGRQEITAMVPTAEILRYVLDLRSMTGGRGTFTAAHDHYDVLPSHLVGKIARPEGNGPAH